MKKNSYYIIAFCLVSICVLFITCKDETVVVQQVCGPYKTTQMKIKVSAPIEDTKVDIQFSIFQKASIHWGDGVVEDANAKLSHVYRDIADYTIEVKGEEKNPSFYISSIAAVEEIFWPMED